jgi:hypothetical protein
MLTSQVSFDGPGVAVEWVAAHARQSGVCAERTYASVA